MAENKDMCVRCVEGVINIRVGAIITKDNHVLMVRNNRDNFFILWAGVFSLEKPRSKR